MERTFDYGKAENKLRDIRVPQSTLFFESSAEVVAEERGYTAARTIESEVLLLGKKENACVLGYNLPC